MVGHAAVTSDRQGVADVEASDAFDGPPRGLRHAGVKKWDQATTVTVFL